MAKRKKKSKSSRQSTTKVRRIRKKKAGGRRRVKSSAGDTATLSKKPTKTRVESVGAAKPGRSKLEVVTTLTHDQIAQRAYEIWLSKGRPLGQDDQNWQEAIGQLTGGAGQKR